MSQANECGKSLGYGLVVFVLSLTTLMSAIDTNIVNIGLPTIEKALIALRPHRPPAVENMEAGDDRLPESTGT